MSLASYQEDPVLVSLAKQACQAYNAAIQDELTQELILAYMRPAVQFFERWARLTNVEFLNSNGMIYDIRANLLALASANEIELGRPAIDRIAAACECILFTEVELSAIQLLELTQKFQVAHLLLQNFLAGTGKWPK